MIGDARKKESLKVKKALAVILYFLGKASFSFLAKLFGVSRSLTYRWIKEEAESLPEPIISNGIKEIEFDEMWHFTHDWEAFKKVLPRERHIIGKRGTITIERDNSNTRHHLGRMTGRTKVVSKKEEMVRASMKLWHALTDPEIFAQYQQRFLSIFM